MGKELPHNWVETDLMSLSSVYTGKKDANYATENGDYTFFTCAYEPLKSDDYSFEGDVLILPGNGVNVGEVFYYSGKFEAYQRTYVVDKIKINPKYLYYHFKIFWRLRGTAEQYGSATNYIKIGNFKSYEVEFPPLPEQQRIVAKLDSLFAHLEEVKTRLEKVPELLKQFRQSVLTQAVTGKLLGCNEYQYYTLDQVCTEFKYGSSSKSLPEGDVPVLRMGNLQNGKIDYSDLKYSTNKDEIEKYRLVKGDVLFNRTNSPELVGKTSIYDGKVDSIYAGYLIKLKCTELIIPEFLNYVMNSSYARAWCWEVKTDGVSQSNINAQKLKSFEVPLPSKEEQTEIVRRVESLFAKADAIEAKYEQLKTQIDNLPQALLAKAFKGELVEQLESDGSAEDLLKEIQKLKNK